MSAGDGDKVQVCPLCLFARIRSTHHTSWKILQNISFSENKISPSITVGIIYVWRRRRHLQLCMRQKQKANEWYTSRPKNIPRHLGKDGRFSSFAWFPAFVANAMVLFQTKRWQELCLKVNSNANVSQTGYSHWGTLWVLPGPGAQQGLRVFSMLLLGPEKLVTVSLLSC